MRIIKGQMIGRMMDAINEELSKDPVGQDFLRRWNANRIRTELKDPCFFGVRRPFTNPMLAAKHFRRIAELS